MHGLDETAARDRQPILLLEEGGDLAVRQAELFVENDGERDGLRTQLCGGGAEGIRRLERMPALDATPAPATPSNVDPNGTDHDTRHRQLFLVLRGDTSLDEVIATAGTPRRQPRVMRLVDARRHAATRLRSIAAAGFASRTFRLRLQRFRKRRRVPEPGAPRVVQLAFQVIDVVAESFAFALQLIPLLAQDIALPFRVLGTFAPVDLSGLAIRIAGLWRSRHAAVMPEFVARYKTR
jgi:hypothetical protein